MAIAHQEEVSFGIPKNTARQDRLPRPLLARMKRPMQVIEISSSSDEKSETNKRNSSMKRRKRNFSKNTIFQKYQEEYVDDEDNGYIDEEMPSRSSPLSSKTVLKTRAGIAPLKQGFPGFKSDEIINCEDSSEGEKPSSQAEKLLEKGSVEEESDDYGQESDQSSDSEKDGSNDESEFEDFNQELQEEFASLEAATGLKLGKRGLYKSEKTTKKNSDKQNKQTNSDKQTEFDRQTSASMKELKAQARLQARTQAILEGKPLPKLHAIGQPKKSKILEPKMMSKLQPPRSKPQPPRSKAPKSREKKKRRDTFNLPGELAGFVVPDDLSDDDEYDPVYERELQLKKEKEERKKQRRLIREKEKKEEEQFYRELKIYHDKKKQEKERKQVIEDMANPNKGLQKDLTDLARERAAEQGCCGWFARVAQTNASTIEKIKARVKVTAGMTRKELLQQLDELSEFASDLESDSDSDKNLNKIASMKLSDFVKREDKKAKEKQRKKQEYEQEHWQDIKKWRRQEARYAKKHRKQIRKDCGLPSESEEDSDFDKKKKLALQFSQSTTRQTGDAFNSRRPSSEGQSGGTDPMPKSIVNDLLRQQNLKLEDMRGKSAEWMADKVWRGMAQQRGEQYIRTIYIPKKKNTNEEVAPEENGKLDIIYKFQKNDNKVSVPEQRNHSSTFSEPTQNHSAVATSSNPTNKSVFANRVNVLNRNATSSGASYKASVNNSVTLTINKGELENSVFGRNKRFSILDLIRENEASKPKTISFSVPATPSSSH